MFLGTPSFAAAHLSALLDAGENVAGVITRPDKPRGRGRKIAPPPVKTLAQSRGIEVIQPSDLHSGEVDEWLKSIKPWLMVVVAYGKILPERLIRLPSMGAWNVHASLLPRWRGAAPIERAVQHGDSRTGVTLMQIDAGMDTGEILIQRETEIGPDETAGELTGRLKEMGCRILLEGIEKARAGELAARPQDDGEATYAPPVRKEEAAIDWSRPAAELHNMVRAFNPRPGARTGELIVWEARPLAGAAKSEPGVIEEVSSEGILVSAGEGLLRILKVQPPGKKAMSAADYARGKRFKPGSRITG